MLAQGLLGGIATGMTMSPGMTAIGHYFNKKRGASMGIAVAGSSVGGVVFPIALAKMFANPKLEFGWTVRIIRFIMLAVLAVSCPPIKARLPTRKKSFFLFSAFKELPYITLLVSPF